METPFEFNRQTALFILKKVQNKCLFTNIIRLNEWKHLFRIKPANYTFYPKKVQNECPFTNIIRQNKFNWKPPFPN